MNLGFPQLNTASDSDWVQIYVEIDTDMEYIDGELWEKGILPRPANE